MTKRRLVPPLVVAALLILSVRAYGDEKGKNITRARFSRKSLLILSGRKQIRETFREAVYECAAELGWSIIVVDDGLALIETESARSWTKVSTSRVREKLKKFLRDEITEDDLINEILPEDGEDEEDE